MEKFYRFKTIDKVLKKTFIYLTSMTLVFTLFVSNTDIHAAIGGDGTDEVNEDYTNGVSLQPLAPAFRMKTLLEWSPEKDPDAQLNRATIPLNKERFQGQQINDLANPDAKITSAAISNANHDKTPSTGGEDFNIYSFDNWQYLDSMIYWASSEEGVLAIPSPDIVDAAHKNGVPVYATLHFPWGHGHYDSLAELESMSVQDENGNYPIGDKLIEVAQYFGFDGYFFNQESYGSTQEVANSTRDLLSYVRNKSRDIGYPINIGWYDAMANKGNVSHQNAVNDRNDLWLKPGGNKNDYAADEFFMNFNWNKNLINSTHNYMKDTLKRNPYDAFAGFEIQQNSYNTKINTDALLDDNGKILSSIALYAPNSTMGFAANAEDFNKHEQILYTGPQKDPSLADDSANWKGMSRFVTDKSVIKGTSFSTNFNTGHGKKWFADGLQVRNRTWNYRSVQDIMPTWRWWIKDQKGTRIDVDYDFNDAFNGGTSLKFSGDLKGNSDNNVMLYSTNIDVLNNSSLDITLKGKTNAKLEVGIAFDKNYKESDLTFFPIESSEKWETSSIDLAQYKGKKIYAISLRVTNNSDEMIDVNFGGLTIKDGISQITDVKNLTIDEQLLRNSRDASARISWDKNENAEKYEVYQVNKDGEEILLGATPSTHFYADKITRKDDNALNDDTTIIRVKAIDKFNHRSKGLDSKFDWGVSLDGSDVDNEEKPVNIALNAEVTDVSFENDAEPASKALDGTATGNSKWAATNQKSGYMTIKLNEPRKVTRWRVEHAEFGGEAQNMNTVDFSLQYKNEQGKWEIAKSIQGNQLAVTDVLLDEPITAQEWKLDITNSGTSPWGAIRIYEWQMFESGFSKTPMLNQYQIKADFDAKKLRIENIDEGSSIRVYDSLSSDKILYEGIANAEGKVEITGVDFTDFDQRIYVSVQTGNLSESFRNSIQNYENRSQEEVYIHTYVNDMGLNATFDIVDEKGKVRSLGGTSDSGIRVKLPVGSYKLVLTSLPIGVYYDEKPIDFKVIENEDNNLIIKLDYYKGYEELGKKIYELGQLDAKLYTEDSFNLMSIMLDHAKEIHKQEATNLEFYQDALDKLNDAAEQLEKVESQVRNELLKLIEHSKLIEVDDYSEESYNNLQDMIKEAELVANDTKSTKDEITTTIETLKKVIGALEEKPAVVDKTPIISALSVVESLDRELYDQKSNDLIDDAIKKANALINNDNATKQEVIEMIKYLEEIPSLLTLKVNKDNLEKLINEVKNTESDQFTKESFKAFDEALKNATNHLNDIDATQEEINDAYHLLAQNYHKLVDVNTPKESSVNELKEKVKQAKKYNAKIYTVETYKILEDAILYGENVLNNLPTILQKNKLQYRIQIRSVATEQDVLDAIKRLNEGIAQLVKVDDSNVDPTDPENPNEPEEPTKPKELKDPKNPTENDLKDNNLPQTGISNSNTQLIVAVLISLAGVGLYFFSKRKEAEN